MHGNLFSDITAVHIVTYWIGALGFLLADNIKSLRSYKLNERHRPSWQEYLEMSAVSIANQCLSLPIIWLTVPYIYNAGAASTAVSWEASTAVSWEASMAVSWEWQLLFYIVVGDMWFYWMHRLMHMNRRLYANIHYYHHQYRYPVAIGTLYANPVEHIICNIMSIMIGPLLWPSCSLKLLLFWVALVTSNGLIAHCGYKLPFADATKHDIHHRYMVYNFGTLGLSDRLFGTIKLIDNNQS